MYCVRSYGLGELSTVSGRDVVVSHGAAVAVAHASGAQTGSCRHCKDDNQFQFLLKQSIKEELDTLSNPIIPQTIVRGHAETRPSSAKRNQHRAQSMPDPRRKLQTCQFRHRNNRLATSIRSHSV